MKNTLETPPPQEDMKFRASVDSKVIGYAKSLNACKKMLSAKKIKEVGGGFSTGYVDEFDHEWQPDDWQQVASRIIAGSGMAASAGWYSDE
tara:strand:+ start:312 stop:584 length:273 start_codon:yes stop_codon:yes gene_type:complete